ncbi:MAG: alpha/beta fold hydrolase [Acholeplasmataceae bacterium]
MKVLKWIFISMVMIFSIMLVSLARVDVPYDVIAANYETEYSEFVDIDIQSLEGETLPLIIHVQKFNEDKEDIIVLIHGVFSSSHTFIEAASLLDDYQVILIDLPGHGLSSLYPDDVTSLRRHADVVFETLQTLDIDTFFLGGNSLGGGVSWYVLYQYQALVDIKGLILIDALSPELVLMMATPSLSFIPSFLINILSSMTPRGLFSLTLDQVYGDEIPSDALVQRHYDLVRREGVRRQVPVFTWEPIDDIDFYEVIHQSNIPVMIVWGQDDQVIPVDIAYQFADRIASHTLIIYDGVGHEPHSEHTEIFVDDLKAFINS